MPAVQPAGIYGRWVPAQPPLGLQKNLANLFIECLVLFILHFRVARIPPGVGGGVPGLWVGASLANPLEFKTSLVQPRSFTHHLRNLIFLEPWVSWCLASRASCVCIPHPFRMTRAGG